MNSVCFTFVNPETKKNFKKMPLPDQLAAGMPLVQVTLCV